jgi:hypothetical protein
MPARVVEIAFLGNTAELERALIRAGLVSETSAKKIQGSADMAGRAAAEQARKMGLSATEQEAAAARAAAAFERSSAKISASQKAAGSAAAAAAKTVGAALDEQKAAYDRAVGATARYEAAQRSAAKASEEAAARQRAAMKSLAGFGGKALGVGLAGFAAAAYEGVKGAMALQKQMEMIRTQAGGTQSQVGLLTKGVLNMASSVATGPQTLAEGMYHVVSSLNATLPAVTRNATELNVLRVAAEGAKVGNANLVDVTNALDAAIVSGVHGVQNYKQAMGALNATVGAGDMTMQNLAEALGTGLLGPMKTYGVSLRDVGAALAVFGDNNIRGADAATKLMSAVRIMSAPSAAAAKWLGAIGLSTLQMAQDIHHGGLVSALSDLKRHLVDSGATAEQQGLVIARAFGGKQSTGVQLLLQQMDRLKAKYAEVGAGANKFGEAFNATSHTLAFQADQLKATIQVLGDKFGAWLIPKLQAAATAVQNLIGWFSRHRVAAEALAQVIGGVLGVAIAAFAYGKAVAFVNSVKAMATGIGSFASMVGRAATSIAVKFGIIRGAETGLAAETAATATAVDGSMAAMATSTEVAAGGITAALGSTGVGLVIIGLSVAATELLTHWSSVWPTIKQVAVDACQGIIDAMNAVIGGLNKLANPLAALGPLGAAAGAVLNLPHLNIIPTIPGISAGGSGSLAGGVAPAITGWVPGPNGTNVPLLSSGGNTLKNTPAFAQAHPHGLSLPGNSALAGLIAGTGTGSGSAGSGRGRAGTSGRIIQVYSGLSPQEQQFVAYMAADTGLDPQVLAAWVRNEEGSRTSPLGHADNNWLNVGWTNSGPVSGTGLAAWATPKSAAQLTAQWMAGTGAMAKAWGPATSGIRGILGTAGQGAAAQMAAITGSGWASGGESLLHTLFAQSANPTVGINVGSGSSRAGTASLAATTSTIPAAIATMLQTAMSLVGTKYVWGGGHGSQFDPVATLKRIGVDCSGFVSAVLHAGGVSMPGPQTTAGLPNYLAKGPGSLVTVWDRAAGSQAHTIIDILGKWFESGGNPQFNPSGGVSNITKAQAAGELAGGGFAAFHPTGLGAPYASVAALSALGISAKGGGTVAAGAIQTQNIGQAIAALIQKIDKALGTSGNSLLTGLNTVIQSGTIKTLERALGVSTGGTLAGPFKRLAPPQSVGVALRNVIERSPTAFTGGTSRGIAGLLDPSMDRSPQGKAFDRLISELRAAHTAALSKLAEGLLAAHRGALAALGQELYAQQLTKDAESLTLEATQQKDRTTLARDTAAKQLQLLKDQQTIAADAAATQLQVAKDTQQIASDSQAAQLQQAKDAQQKITDQMTAAATGIKDMTSIVTDKFTAMVQAITDSTRLMADASASVVQGIADRTQVQVDILGERGLYGLNLIAQRLQVQLDQMKASDDQKIAAAQRQLDVTQAQASATIAGAQLAADQVQAQQDQLVALAQQNADTVQLSTDGAIAAAQQHLDAVQLNTDQILGNVQQHLDAVTLSQDSKVALAQQHVDAVSLLQDINVQLAQTAVDLSANAPKAQQDAAAAQLKRATATSDLAISKANATLSTTQSTAAAIIQGAQGEAAAWQQQVALAQQQAQSEYATAVSAAMLLQQQASGALSEAQGKAAIAIALAQLQLANATGQANAAVAAAQQYLQITQETAAQQEAQLGANVSLAQAMARTEFAGTGTVVNIYGIPATNAAAIGGALDWVARTQLGVSAPSGS